MDICRHNSDLNLIFKVFFVGTDALSPDYAISNQNGYTNPQMLTNEFQSFGTNYIVWTAVNVQNINTLYISFDKSGGRPSLSYIVYRADTAQFIPANDSFWTRTGWCDATIDTSYIDGVLVFCITSPDQYTGTLYLHK